ncbi:MAG: LysR family transcriptional regulator [Acidaminococcaceae bacterium]|nr:LysR family transcriptional regulator [Acidaminococcaceae bacterium]
MNIDYYRNFTIIVETGSLSKAANKIPIAQSALSNQINLLEEKYHTPLLITKRGIRKIVLTDAGRILYNKAKFICELEDNAAHEIEDCSFGGRGTLRISLSPSAYASFIQHFLSKFSQRYPNVNFELYEVSIRQQTQQLLNGFTEIGVANAPLFEPEKFDIHFTLQENLAAIFTKKAPLLSPDKENLALADLAKLPLCLSRGCSTLFQEFCRKEQMKPNILSINTTKLAAIAWAKQGIGVAIAPIGHDEDMDSALYYRPLNNPGLVVAKTLVTVKDRELSPVAQKFLDFCNTVKFTL